MQLIIQSVSFSVEKQHLAEEKPINKKSRIAVYSPFLGPGCLKRSTGRIKRFTSVDFNFKTQ